MNTETSTILERFIDLTDSISSVSSVCYNGEVTLVMLWSSGAEERAGITPHPACENRK